MASRYGDTFADTILRKAREQYEALIPEFPYIGGDENPMTRQLLLTATNLALYKPMKARGRTARKTGKIVYDALVERFSVAATSFLLLGSISLRR